MLIFQLIFKSDFFQKTSGEKFLKIEDQIEVIEKDEENFKKLMDDKNNLLVRSELSKNEFLLSIRVNKMFVYMIWKLYGKNTNTRNNKIKDLIVKDYIRIVEQNPVLDGDVQTPRKSEDSNGLELKRLKRENKQLSEENATLRNAFVQFYKLFIAINTIMNTEKNVGGNNVSAVLWDEFTKLSVLIDLKLIDGLKNGIITNMDKMMSEITEALK